MTETKTDNEEIMQPYTKALIEVFGEIILTPFTGTLMDIIFDYFNAVPEFQNEFVKYFLECENDLLKKNVIYPHISNKSPEVLRTVLLYQVIYKDRHTYLLREFAHQYNFEQFYAQYNPSIKEFHPNEKGEFDSTNLVHRFIDFLVFVPFNTTLKFRCLDPYDEQTKYTVDGINLDIAYHLDTFDVEKRSNLWAVMTFVFRLMNLIHDIILKLNQDEPEIIKSFNLSHIYASLNKLYEMMVIIKRNHNVIADSFLETLFIKELLS